MAEMHSDSTPTHHGHETQDVNIRVVALFALSMAVVLAGSLALMAWVFGIIHTTPAGHGPRGRAPIAATSPRPPAPRLQTSSTGELQEMRHAENVRLQSYGWVDRSIGMVRIPIDRAMQMVVEQGLPSWHEIPTPATDTRDSKPEERR
jgi:hypothetical protein